MTGLCDIHCHLLPGVDDGSRNMDESVQMLRRAYEDGVRYIMATPHFRYDMFECPIAEIQMKYEELQAEAEKIGDGICLKLGCEFYACMDMTDMLRAGERPTMNHTKYVLIELSHDAEWKNVREYVYRLVSGGYKPIIAHIERYPAIVLDLQLVEELTELGAEIQVNAESVIGDSGWCIKNICKKLMKADLLDYIATDAHNMRSRSPQLGKCAAYIERKYGENYANKIFQRNPEKLFREK